ncbi:MAG: L-seryl-tRNA(Sec) selenium transferase, partial [Defluviitaleaceae bacterium]|nr:L-seryl-tRNA(Sec) selenium transferase [Defluviitaleaceae bacterium]
MDKNLILRNLPKMDDILQEPSFSHLSKTKMVEASGVILEKIRKGILSGEITSTPPYQEILKQILDMAEGFENNLKRVINATGVVLHTNLGRAPMAKAAAEAAYNAAIGYCDLEFDLETGGRGSRTHKLEKLLTSVTGAEAGIVVNNNAAAVLLVLSALCTGQEVVASRGEMVEIGGSFRVPEIIFQGGAILKEVGTTNSTTLKDYQNAITDNTGALLKIHTSNYRIMGYTKETDIKDLASLAKSHNMPLIYDLGGGALIDLSSHEPKVQKLMAEGVDVLCFSGDKLLGGPQAGIILGKADLIEKIRKHPLYRAMRMDKLTLASLTATLEIYQDIEQAKKDIPTLAMLTADLKHLENRAIELLKLLPDSPRYIAEAVEVNGQAGGGSLPCENFPSYALSIEGADMSTTKLEQALRGHTTPIITRIHKGKLLMDLRTIGEDGFKDITRAFE